MVGDNSTKNTGYFMSIIPMRSPAFWELPELRCMYSYMFRDLIPYTGSIAAVLTYISERTSSLDATDVARTLGTPLFSSNLSLDMRQVQAVYTILKYTPMEYLPKSVRIDLTKKAVVFDAQSISALKIGSTDNDLMGVLSLSREYISRSITHAAVFDRLVLCHLLPPKWS